ncbi:cation diffusion facilitator family transporter [Eggerthia catenaformis OT 569 = DSM 20559]|uniref:Cation diffusion facilitator family transporter n=2 Tax=Eggerthia catenaformis TaxID=31973 RepID=M2Q5X0_9FIRM|nr:cation diffusion facilitator family transporter [Eggerthia catenaformis]EMD17586.1 cation diffusion facilitator family transporter [Eggerthia catenaformis OT 569 = DSM 20559]
MSREKAIVKTSIIGIVINILLAIFKVVIGIISHSIAIRLDAVNNLSDALSSVITIIGAKLGAKKPDKKHPLGYGRIEYLSAMIVVAIVLYAGITSAVESIKKMITPEKVEYSTISLIIITVAIAVKLVLGKYTKAQGEKHNSGALIASGSDASFDAVLSASVLFSAIIFIIWQISLEAYVGMIIAIFIIKAEVEMMSDTLNEIVGKRSNSDMIKKIKTILCQEDEVRGAYDLILYNYGPNKNYGSVHLELPDQMTVNEVDLLTRRVQAKVYLKTGVILTDVGVYSFNTSDNESASIRNNMQEKVFDHE